MNNKILFFLNHPAHYHLFKNVIKKLKEKGHEIIIFIVTKDVLEDLAKTEGWQYTNLIPEGRRSKRKFPKLFKLFYFMLKTEIRLYKALKKNKPDLMVGTERTITHVGWLMRIPSLYVNEDDTSATPENKITYPFATKVLMPKCTDIGLWKKKKITYDGYHELAYLHPLYFTADKEKTRSFNPEGKRYFIIRLAELSASHDKNKKGINDEIALKLIGILEGYGKVFITAERKLPEILEKYRIRINPQDIFHVLACADMYIGDSQTMSIEAAVLGTPSLRFNDFVGIISVLNELDNLYELTIGFKTNQEKEFLNKVKEIAEMPRLKEHWKQKAKRMLVEKENVVEVFVNTIEGLL